MIDTRSADYEILRRGMNSPDPNVRRQARVAYERLQHEGPKVKSLREALVKAHRDGNKEEIKDIHEFVRTHSEYQTWGRKQTWR